MKTGREDYEGAGKSRAIHEEEPTFILRAQDDVAVAAAEFWCAESLRRGAPAAVIEQALQQVDRMRAWPLKKVADADHLKPAERDRLEAAFHARAWASAPAAVRDEHDLFTARARGEGYAAGRRTGERDALARIRDADRRAERLQEQLDAARAELARLGVVGAEPTVADETAYLDFERGAGLAAAEADLCPICDEPKIEGQLMLTDVTLGEVHADCCGPERESYVNLETGDPIEPDQPIPAGYPYKREG